MKIRNLKVCLALLLFYLWVPALSHADTLYLKSGDTFEGELVREDGDEVIFRTEGAEISFQRHEVERIEKRAASGVLGAVVQKEKSGGYFKKFWEGVEEGFGLIVSKDRRSSRSRGPLVESIGMVLLIQMIASLLFTAYAMKLYFAIFHEHAGYFRMVWFQIKVALFSGFFLFVTGAAVAFLAALLTGGKNMPAVTIWAVASGLIAYVVTFYRRAKKDLDAGFLTAFGLAIVMWLSNALVLKVLQIAGIVPQMEQLASYGQGIWQ